MRIASRLPLLVLIAVASHQTPSRAQGAGNQAPARTTVLVAASKKTQGTANQSILDLTIASHLRTAQFEVLDPVKGHGDIEARLAKALEVLKVTGIDEAARRAMAMDADILVVYDGLVEKDAKQGTGVFRLTVHAFDPATSRAMASASGASEPKVLTNASEEIWAAKEACEQVMPEVIQQIQEVLRTDGVDGQRFIVGLLSAPFGADTSIAKEMQKTCTLLKTDIYEGHLRFNARCLQTPDGLRDLLAKAIQANYGTWRSTALPSPKRLVLFAFDAGTTRTDEPAAFGKARGGLAIGVRLGGDTAKPGDPIPLFITLKNVGTKPLNVNSYVAAEDPHLDWFTVTLTFPVPGRGGCEGKGVGKAKLALRLFDAREKSGIETRTLAPGQSLSHQVDLSAWARRTVNGGKDLHPGFYQVQVQYKVPKAKVIWTGTINSNRERLTVEGAPPKGRCPENPGWEYF